ncbi:hypothetical protein PRZ48_007118 [Zasmidium cellare]|uniref:Uncharacterized protein n=1 Tax=Zasmidium cellare TaxID=395010 RepID=A0ABR0EJB6_ZASCE|nr:hypothetical protein PRZ48_007118 [Zasmidium cellare]
MVPPISKVDHDRNLLRIVIDHGTGEQKISAQWIPAGASNRNPTPFTIRLDGQGAIVQKAVLVGDLETGRLIWGERDVNSWSRHNPGQVAKVCQLWKLVLCKKYRNTPTGQAVFKAIGAEHGNMETFEEFLTMHFKQVREMIIDRLVTHHSHLAGLKPDAEAREYWTNIVQVETLLMVPAGWDQDAQSIMVAAATDAGFNNVGPVYESLVAVASEIHCAEESRHVAEGNIIVVTDLGRGTGFKDISSGMLQPNTRVLKLAGKYPTCGMAGAQLTNDAGRAWVETCSDILRHGKNVLEVCKRMGISIEDFRYRVSDEFERVKRDFPNSMDFQLTIRAPAGWDKIENGLAKVDIDVPWEKMKDFFDYQLKRVFRLLDKHMKQHEGEKIHGAIATGGGAKNPYVRQRLDEYFLERCGFRCFDPQDRHPTCHAALQHYPENHPQQLPTGVLYICRGEELDKKVHTDAVYGSGLIKRNLVKADGAKKRTRIDWVDDRLTTIMSRDDGEQPIGRRVVMVFNVLASNPGRIKFPLFHSADANKEHQAAYGEDREPQADLTKWTVRFANMTGDLDKDKHNFPAVTINGRDHYVVTTIVGIEGDDTHLDLVLQVVKAEDLQYDEEGQARVDIDYQPLTERRIEVWDRFRSYFPIKDEACPEEKVMASSTVTDNTGALPKLEPSPSPASTPMPVRSRQQARPELSLQTDKSGSTNVASQYSTQQRADSGVSLSAKSQGSGLFVSDIDSTTAQDPLLQPTPPFSKRSKLSHPSKKRKWTSHKPLTPSQLDMWAVDADEDELALEQPAKKTKAPTSKPAKKTKSPESSTSKATSPARKTKSPSSKAKSPAAKTKSPASKAKSPTRKAKPPANKITKSQVHAEGKSLFARFARKTDSEDDDEDDEETIAVTRKKTAPFLQPNPPPVSPATSQRSPEPQQHRPSVPQMCPSVSPSMAAPLQHRPAVPRMSPSTSPNRPEPLQHRPAVPQMTPEDLQAALDDASRFADDLHDTLGAGRVWDR